MTEYSGDFVASSLLRSVVEEMLVTGKTPVEIVKFIADKHSEVFVPEEIAAYQEQYMKMGRGLVSQVFSVAKDLARNELPVATDFDLVARHFSFQKTNEDLEMIYSRIRQLKADAEKNGMDESYDNRICKYITQAEAIRTRVIKNQFDNLRKAILLTIGKKIATAAVNVFAPYIIQDKRDEAKQRFLDTIEPLIDAEIVPAKPDDIKNIEDSLK